MKHRAEPNMRTLVVEELARRSAVRKQRQREERRERDRRAWLRRRAVELRAEVESRHA